MKIAMRVLVVVTMAMVSAGVAGCTATNEDAAVVGSTTVVEPVAAVASDDDGLAPVITYERKRETGSIPFRSVTRKTATLKKGVTKVAQRGRPGVRVKIFRLTLEDGVQVDRELISNTVRRKPVNRIVLQGTRVPEPAPSRQCDPNYGGCVPIAYDVDCAGGSGDGPKYVQGPVRVVGDDIYDLDADGDGWGCD